MVCGSWLEVCECGVDEERIQLEEAQIYTMNADSMITMDNHSKRNIVTADSMFTKGTDASLLVPCSQRRSAA